ncbi:hypothetical protein HIM_10648 [Hirsutella minnesotensis 3608]|uniref:EKC/KEOPS complex subunit BUD32 n=1 Tax=Hirsutella minnesotensis 3608 TaxID=1043627 RepID=A0A0F7ZFY6_9HYPO|nr:hypothetical protein HIM_10648 [Hirsutella minnesotensis 3608]
MSSSPLPTDVPAPHLRMPLDSQRGAGGEMSMMFFVQPDCPVNFAYQDEHRVKGLNAEAMARVLLPPPAWLLATEYAPLRSDPGHPMSAVDCIRKLRTKVWPLPKSFDGSTSLFLRVQRGVLLKYPRQIRRESSSYKLLTDKIANNFLVERHILDLLGRHPRIVPYLGWHRASEGQQGVLLMEASHGNLQRYLDDHYDATSSLLRMKWCLQAVESIVYIHRRGIIHSDIRPDNFLVHATTPTSLDLWLCDFGGSTCENFGLDGGHLPDSGFYDPRSEPVSTAQTDIFSVASVLYTILTGHWPYRGPGSFKTGAEMEEYRQKVDDLFARRLFPDIDGLFAGKVIKKCWRNEYANAEEVLQELRTYS